MTEMLTTDWKCAVAHWQALTAHLKPRAALLEVYPEDNPERCWRVLIKASGAILTDFTGDRNEGWNVEYQSGIWFSGKGKDAHMLAVPEGEYPSALKQAFYRPLEAGAKPVVITYNVIVEV